MKKENSLIVELSKSQVNNVKKPVRNDTPVTLGLPQSIFGRKGLKYTHKLYCHQTV